MVGRVKGRESDLMRPVRDGPLERAIEDMGAKPLRRVRRLLPSRICSGWCTGTSSVTFRLHHHRKQRTSSGCGRNRLCPYAFGSSEGAVEFGLEYFEWRSWRIELMSA